MQYRRLSLFTLCVILTSLCHPISVACAADADSPDRLVEDPRLSQALAKIVADLKLDGEFPTDDGRERISLAVIDLTGREPRLGGVNAKSFIYPASVYKMYVAAEVLRQIEEGPAALDTPFNVRAPNVVDRTKEIPADPRPLLVEGDEVTLGYLLDLMITRSDNTAANCLIDFAQRPKINELLHSYGWQGSEVTRKFLKRPVEDEAYRKATGTQTCALHAADFLYRIRTGTLASPWVSMQMESLLGRQLDTAKMSRGLPRGAMFYHKTGWYANWTHDVGIVDDGRTRFVIAAFLPLPEKTAPTNWLNLAGKYSDSCLRSMVRLVCRSCISPQLIFLFFGGALFDQYGPTSFPQVVDGP